MTFVKVAIINAPYHIDKPYTYHLPTELEKKVKVGSVVVVPFGGGNKQKCALVTQISSDSDCAVTKPVLGVPGKYMFVEEEMLKLCEFMKEYFFCSLGDAVACVIPSGLGVKKARFYSRNINVSDEEVQLNNASRIILSDLTRNGDMSETQLKKQYGAGAVSCVRALEKMNLCTSYDDFECKVNTKSERYVVLTQDESTISDITDGTIKMSPKQMSVFETLLRYESPCPVTELCESSGAGISVINELSKKGVISFVNVDFDRSKSLISDYSDKGYSKDFVLSESQNDAYEKLLSMYKSDSFSACLLHGVTGSGKTNVMLKLIQSVIDDGKSVIVLVPEIALTSQTVGRFSALFGDKIALIHSALSAGERMDAWKAITEGKAKIVIGTRSAVFAPVKNLGLIVIDEEQESSFKSEKSPKYNAKDVAGFRCVYNKALLLLASATPSIDTYYKAKTGKYNLITLTERYGGATLPTVMFHDMRNEPYFETKTEDVGEDCGAIPTTIGTTLEAELAENLVNGEQSILFINRRGFRSFAQCHSCGHTFQCPNCSVPLTHHRNKRFNLSTMNCHYCGHSEQMPTVCPVCKKSDSIVYMGAGTQLLESRLYELFPNIRVLRMDADTTTGRMSHEKILEKFRNHEADVLVGTQMVAKGHDFPDVSLVGVINADVSLYANDFRANEKTFSLITQVLGRSGRGTKPGRAVIQTYRPDNDVLLLSSKQSYEEFYEREILFRKASYFPPFCNIITITFSSEIENDLINAVKQFSADIDKKAKEEYADLKFILYGPFRNDVYKIAGRYRMRFLLKCSNSAKMRKMISELLKKYMAGLRNVAISADINPQNL